MSFIHHDELVLSIDRTEWDFGKTQINILCVIVNIGKMGIPLYFEMLDNKSGNSNWQNRIDLLTSLIKKVDKSRIALVVMDREFIGAKWLTWLKSESIPFCVRVPKHHKITFSDGTRLTAEQLLEDRKSFYAKDVFVDCIRTNVAIKYDKNGDLLYLIGTAKPTELMEQYRKRWSIEVFFQALKGRGFRLKDSCLRSIEKYRKLFAVVSMAYTICWAMGIQDGKTNPVKVKKHGYPQYSVFRRGLNLMREFYKDKINEHFDKIIEIAFRRLDMLII